MSKKEGLKVAFRYFLALLGYVSMPWLPSAKVLQPFVAQIDYML